MRYLVFPDLHGHFDELQKLVSEIVIMQEWRFDHVVVLGDVIDGGPDSRKVLEYLMPRTDGHYWVTIKGNHDQMLIDAWRHPQDKSKFRLWFMQGGAATLKSFGGPTHPDAAMTTLREYILPHVIDWLDARPLYYVTPSFLFVHAGLRPGVPLDEQAKQDLLWIRGEFINSDFDFGKRVVFGHTTFKEPLVMPNKIGLDTKGRSVGVLTAALLDDDHPDEIEFITSG